MRAALEALPPQPRVVASGNLATPWELVGLLDAVQHGYRLFVLNVQGCPPNRPGVVVETPFVGPGARGRTEGLVYLPMRLSLVPGLFSSTHPPDAVLLHTTLPRDGQVSLGIEVNVLPAAIDAARRRGGLVVAQCNASMPFTGGDALIDLDDVDLAIEATAPLPELRAPAAAAHANGAGTIGERAAAYVADGGTIQLGIGAIPDAVAHSLRGKRGLGVWSEMASDGVLALEHAGALDVDRPLQTSFLMGTAELYEWADGNQRLLLGRTERINDPGRIAAQPGMVSINGAIEVDLYAQSNASHVAGCVHSGFGGQPDFVTGALHSRGGHAIIVLHAWHEPTGASKLVPLLSSPTTSFQHSVVVTEYGAAELHGRSQEDQATELVARAADPRAREQLSAAVAARRPGGGH